MFGLICVILVLAYFEGVMDRIGIPDFVGKLIREAPIVLLAVHLLGRTRFRSAVPGGWLVLLFAFWTMLAGAATGTGPYVSFLWCRHVLYSYVIFAAIWGGRISFAHVMKILRLIFFLWILQIAAALYEILVLGQRVESYVGTMGNSGGGLANDFPLFSMAYMLALFLFYASRFRIGILAVSFLIVAYASCKRAVYFYAPIVAGAVVLENLLVSIRLNRLITTPLVKMGAILLLSSPLYFYGLRSAAGIGDAPPQYASRTQRLRFATEYAQKYETTVSEDGRTLGRVATTVGVFRRSRASGWFIALFGVGPGAFREDRGYLANEFFRVGYGCAGWAADTIAVGWPGMMLRVFFLLAIWRPILKARTSFLSPFGQALVFGTHTALGLTILLYFTYAYGSVAYPQTLFVLFFVAGLISSPHYRPFLWAVPPPPHSAAEMVRSSRIHGLEQESVARYDRRIEETA